MWYTAHSAHQLHSARDFGFDVTVSGHDWSEGKKRRDRYVARLNDIYASNLEKRDVSLIRGTAHIKGSHSVEVAGQGYKADRFVIATGSSPLVPAIPGLDDVAFLTNETLFDYDRPMAHLLVIGGGPIGVEMAQAHRRLGAAVTIIEMARLLPNDDEELTAVVQDCLAGEGIDIRAGVKVERVAGTAYSSHVIFRHRPLWVISGPSPQY